MIATAGTAAADADLVAAVRAGDDAAFEELYRRYNARITAFVCRMLRDEAGCEDVAQEAFMSALRRMRATDAEIDFKPWIYQIARNAAIDAYRRGSHAVEVSMDADDGLRAADRQRLVGVDDGPDSALLTKERLTHLQGAFDELSDVHTQVLVMRELEGMSYREIGRKLDLTRPAVESALFRARRRLESEYMELSEGRRCEAARATIARMAAGTHRGAEEHRLARHAKRCPACLREAREQGVEPLTRLGTLRRKVAALLPLPWLFRRSDGDGGGVFGLLSTGANAAPLAERAAALVAAAALVGAGGVALGGGAVPGDRAPAGEDRNAAQPSATVRGESQRGTAGPAADGERAGARRTSGRGGSGPAGGRAGGSDGLRNGSESVRAPAGGSGPSGGPIQAAPGDPTEALPSLPNAAPAPPSGEVELSLPEAPSVTVPEAELPPVQLPELDAAAGELDGVTGELDGVTGELDGVTGVLP